MAGGGGAVVTSSKATRTGLSSTRAWYKTPRPPPINLGGRWRRTRCQQKSSRAGTAWVMRSAGSLLQDVLRDFRKVHQQPSPIGDLPRQASAPTGSASGQCPSRRSAACARARNPPDSHSTSCGSSTATAAACVEESPGTWRMSANLREVAKAAHRVTAGAAGRRPPRKGRPPRGHRPLPRSSASRQREGSAAAQGGHTSACSARTPAPGYCGSPGLD